MLRIVSVITGIFVLGPIASADQSQDLTTVLENARLKNAPTEAHKTQKLGFKPMGPIHSVKNESAGSPQKAMELYNARKSSPHCVPSIRPNSGGQVEGFKCFGITNGGALQKAGLLDGDVVTSVDGRGLNSPEEAMEFLTKVNQNAFSEIRVLRNGQEEILSSEVR